MTTQRPAEPTSAMTDRIVTLPNAISLARLVLLLPLAMWLLFSERYGWALVTLLLLGASDWIDGWLARRLDQRTLLGMRLDPVADRIAVVLIALTLALTGVLPWWMLGAIAVVDLVLLVLAGVIVRGSPDLPVTRIGKWRTAALFLGLPLLIVARATELGWLHGLALTVTGLGVAGHVLAGAGYAAAILRRR